MLIELAQLLRGDLLLFKKPELRRPAIMTREVVRRTRKPRRPRPIPHAPARRLGEISELTEPSREHGSECGVLRKPQEGVARPELAVLVAAAHDICPLQSFLP